MAVTDLFKTTGDLRVYLPMIEASKPITELEFAFRQPEGKMKELLGEATYDVIKAHYAGDYPDQSIKDNAVKYLQGALANMAYEIFHIMDAGERNETKNIYRYQEDLQRGVFRDTANAEIGQLLVLLDSDVTTFSEWATTTLYTTRLQQLLKTHAEFGKYYYIDESAYFFSRLVFLMKEITADKLTPLIGAYADLDPEDETDGPIIEQAKKTLAYLTVAMALRRFDFAEIPKTIRNNVAESIRTVRTSGQEDQAVRRVADEIEVKGMQYLQILGLMIEKKNTGTLAEPEEINDEDNSFYLQT